MTVATFFASSRGLLYDYTPRDSKRTFSFAPKVLYLIYSREKQPAAASSALLLKKWAGAPASNDLISAKGLFRHAQFEALQSLDLLALATFRSQITRPTDYIACFRYSSASELLLLCNLTRIMASPCLALSLSDLFAIYRSRAYRAIVVLQIININARTLRCSAGIREKPNQSTHTFTSNQSISVSLIERTPFL